MYHSRRSQDGDSIVHFRSSDVIATGEIFDFPLPAHRSRQGW